MRLLCSLLVSFFLSEVTARGVASFSPGCNQMKEEFQFCMDAYDPDFPFTGTDYAFTDDGRPDSFERNMCNLITDKVQVIISGHNQINETF